MKKRLLALYLALVLCLSLLPVTAYAGGPPSYSGEGSKENPYKLSTSQDLQELSSNVQRYDNNTYFALTANIGSGTGDNAPVTTIIGNQDKPFLGHIDGAGYTVTLDIDNYAYL